MEQVPCGEVPEERPSSVLGLALGREHQGRPQPAERRERPSASERAARMAGAAAVGRGAAAHATACAAMYMHMYMCVWLVKSSQRCMCVLRVARISAASSERPVTSVSDTDPLMTDDK